MWQETEENEIYQECEQKFSEKKLYVNWTF